MHVWISSVILQKYVYLCCQIAEPVKNMPLRKSICVTPQHLVFNQESLLNVHLIATHDCCSCRWMHLQKWSWIRHSVLSCNAWIFLSSNKNIIRIGKICKCQHTLYIVWRFLENHKMLQKVFLNYAKFSSQLVGVRAFQISIFDVYSQK